MKEIENDEWLSLNNIEEEKKKLKKVVKEVEEEKLVKKALDKLFGILKTEKSLDELREEIYREINGKRIKYDKENDILTIKLSDKKPIESEHLIEQGIVVDYDENDNIIGLEIFDWSERKGKDNTK
ncbi:DUF2283 domain-containing protein [Persephonella atlantica]|uniref:DUF2283 domain-containing protein n=2 Tax=Persephonella atlantica TaxID=2699429 RepID=A0ABS1GKD8_9AQUI|nr:DUF2283 domain-containing protein [Persephonella atlantica]